MIPLGLPGAAVWIGGIAVLTALVVVAVRLHWPVLGALIDRVTAVFGGLVGLGWLTSPLNPLIGEPMLPWRYRTTTLVDGPMDTVVFRSPELILPVGNSFSSFLLYTAVALGLVLGGALMRYRRETMEQVWEQARSQAVLQTALSRDGWTRSGRLQGLLGIFLGLLILGAGIHFLAGGGPDRFTVTDFSSSSQLNEDKKYEIRVSGATDLQPLGTTNRSPTQDITQFLLQDAGTGPATDLTVEELTARQRALTRPDTVVPYNGTYYNLTLHRFNGSRIHLAWDATLLDNRTTPGDPATIRLAVTNTGDRTLSISSGVMWPFDVYRPVRSDGHSFLLWSPSYAERIRGWSGSAHEEVIIPAVGITRSLGPGNTTAINYTVSPHVDGVQHGRYTVNGSFSVAAFEDAVPDDAGALIAEKYPGRTFRYRFSFRISPDDHQSVSR